jgi:hypothetical protein
MSSSGGIRPFEHEDLDVVARLWERVFGGTLSVGLNGTKKFLEHTLLANPWADPELPSLVSVEDARITGFIGASVRRMSCGSRPVRVVSSAHLMIDPTTSNRAIGALLLARLLRGRQELTTTDSASSEVRAMWLRLGGDAVQLGSVSWLRPFRSADIARSVLGPRRWFLRGSVRPLWSLADAIAERLLDSLYPAEPGVVAAEPLTPASAARHLPEFTAPFRLRPVYEEAYLQWLFEELDRFGEGTPVRRLVQSHGRVLGSYVYLLQPHAISRVLQVAAREDDADAVLADLFAHAEAHGAAALRGRVEPHLQHALRRCGVLLLPTATHMLIHSSERELLHLIHSGDALTTLLDGEWWSGMRSPTWRERSSWRRA